MVGGGGKRRPGGEGQQGERTVDVKKSKSCEADVSSDLRKEVENHYKLSLPEDFYHFWKFCEELDPEKPADSLSASLGLRLVGPYDILAGKHKTKKKSASLNFNLHWRFYYDPPEFQTIIIGDNKTQFHMGYFRDAPDELPVYVGTNEAKKNCIIVQNGDNVFAAVRSNRKLLYSKGGAHRILGRAMERPKPLRATFAAELAHQWSYICHHQKTGKSRTAVTASGFWTTLSLT